MPRNPTTGIYTPVVNSFADPVVGEVIDPTDAQALFDDQTDALNDLPAILVEGPALKVSGADATNVFPDLSDVHLELLNTTVATGASAQIWWGLTAGTPYVTISSSAVTGPSTSSGNLVFSTTTDAEHIPPAPRFWFVPGGALIASPDIGTYSFGRADLSDFIAYNIKGDKCFIGYATNTVADPGAPTPLYVVAESVLTGIASGGAYIEGRVYKQTIGGGAEIDAQNVSDAVPKVGDPNNPYGTGGTADSSYISAIISQPEGSRLDPPSWKDASTWAHIYGGPNQNVRFIKGIIFDKSSLRGNGGNTEAISLPVAYQVAWYDATGANVVRLQSPDGLGLYINNVRIVDESAAQELTNKTLTSAVAKGTWTASGTWTLPTLTLGGTVSGGGNQINNVIIGTSTPLAGSFTTLAASTSATVTSASASALTAGRLGATTPAFQVDASTATSVTGVKVKSAASGGGVAVSAIGETNVNLTLDASGSGTITLGGTSTGAITLTRAATLSAALTYGGVTLTNAVTGTGDMVLSASPTLTGTVSGAALTLSGALTYGGVALSAAVTGTGNMVLSAAPTLTGTTTIATLALTTVGAHTISGAITYGGVTLSNAVTGTGNMVLSAGPTITGHATIEGVTATGATGTGKFVFDTSPTLVTPVLGVATATTLNGVTIDNNAWSTYVPTVTAGSGTFTTVSGAGRYKVIGKVVVIEIVITVTTNGSAATYIQATLPHTLAASAAFYGFLTGTNLSVNGLASVADNKVLAFKYDGSYPGVSGQSITLNAVYEI